jgi:hypothetical protein
MAYVGPKSAVFLDLFKVVTLTNVFGYHTVCSFRKNRRFGDHIAFSFRLIFLACSEDTLHGGRGREPLAKAPSGVYKII